MTALFTLALTPGAWAWLPGTSSPTAVDGFSVNAADRRDVLAFYNCIYTASEGYASNIAWTGNVASTIPGTTSAAFKDDVRRRVNFFRALCGLPADITFDATKSSKDQEAALMMSANNALSHTPPPSWLGYTANGAEAAGASNIALGTFGPGSVNAYMRDDGSNNTVVGHRRWILYSRAQEMGTGDIPFNGSYNAANALWVIGNFKAAPTPAFTTWPNEGFVPASLTPARWSLSYPGADFGSATVTMTQNGSNVPLTIISNSTTNVGDNSIVWEPTGLPSSVTSDVPYVVTVSGIGGGGPTSKTYTVTLFNPDILGDSITIAGTNTPSTSGQGYTFNSIAQADSYQVEVSTGSTAAWTEGAEDSPAPQITEGISAGYTLRQTGLVRTGSKAFQLTYPSGVFSDQTFTVTRNVIPGATSNLQFYDRARFSVTTTTLEAQVSTDNGSTWTTVSTRNGVGLSSALWDASWISRNVSLSAYAGLPIQVRFTMKANGGSVTQGASSSFGFFIDDITITNATQLVNTTTTMLAGSATSFNLNATTAGSALVNGTSYYLRARPNVGCRWFGFGALKTVTAQTPSGYAGWVASQYPGVIGGFTADHENDGIANGAEYAFGLNPTAANNLAILPQATLAGSTLTFSYTEPPSITGITYGAEWSENLTVWNPITDTGSGTSHLFSVSTTGKTKVFIRHKITQNP
ncbi:MAG: hypothetical protein JNM99_22185 [Verrucomicrobiaceae bacterium]|nr:hypothetical protein [Verrucomicrobiaceae bacterium]